MFKKRFYACTTSKLQRLYKVRKIHRGGCRKNLGNNSCYAQALHELKDEEVDNCTVLYLQYDVYQELDGH